MSDKPSRFQFSLRDLFWVMLAACGTAFCLQLLYWVAPPGKPVVATVMGVLLSVPVWSLALSLSGRAAIGIRLLQAWAVLLLGLISLSAVF